MVLLMELKRKDWWYGIDFWIEWTKIDGRKKSGIRFHSEGEKEDDLEGNGTKSERDNGTGYTENTGGKRRVIMYG